MVVVVAWRALYKDRANGGRQLFYLQAERHRRYTYTRQAVTWSSFILANPRHLSTSTRAVGSATDLARLETKKDLPTRGNPAHIRKLNVLLHSSSKSRVDGFTSQREQETYIYHRRRLSKHCSPENTTHLTRT